MARGFDLSAYGLHAPDVIYDPSLGLLYEDGVVCDGDWITATGALATSSGDRTRRSPRDRRIVECPGLDGHVDWNEFNQILPQKSFDLLRRAAVDYLNTCGRLYVIDGYYGTDPQHRFKVRVICARAYHALFIRTMLIRPPVDERGDSRSPDVLIFHAGQAPADPKTPGLSSAVSVSIELAGGEVVILGTDYAAEMKAALFTLASYRFARQGQLPLRAAAIEHDPAGLTLLVGLPGAGKSALALGSGQRLVSDDALVWTEHGVFNLEGGCYPRCQGLTPGDQPEVAAAIRFGAILENVVVNPRTRLADFRDTTLTDNTRAAFPLAHVSAPGSSPPGHPANVILLTCDATGVLPPVSRLTAEQAAYHFLSGYFSKLPAAAHEPAECVFSPCCGAGLLVQGPETFVKLLLERLRANPPHVWLVNTGCSGSPAAGAKRIELSQSRAIVEAIASGALQHEPTITDPIFGGEVPAHVAGVPDERLRPWESWPSREAYRTAALRLAEQFQANFQQHADWASVDLAAAGPRVSEVAAT